MIRCDGRVAEDMLVAAVAKDKIEGAFARGRQRSGREEGGGGGRESVRGVPPAELGQGPVQFGVKIATNLLETTRRDDHRRQGLGAEGAEIQRAFAAGKDLAQDAGIEALALGRVSGDLIAALQRCPVGFGLQMQLRGVHGHGEIDNRRARAVPFQAPFAGLLAQGKGLFGGDLVDAVAGAEGAGEGGGDGDDLAGSDEFDAALPLAQLLDVKARPALSLFGWMRRRSPRWRRSRLLKVMAPSRKVVTSPRKRPVAPAVCGATMSVGVPPGRKPLVGGRPKESLSFSLAAAMTCGRSFSLASRTAR